MEAVGRNDWLEGAAINIFTMSYLHHHDDKFLVLNTVNNPISTLTYFISIMSR